MQSDDLFGQCGYMVRTGGPVPKTGADIPDAVNEAVGDGVAAKPLELGQQNHHLPVASNN